MPLAYRAAIPPDSPHCVELRGQTRQNAFSAEALAALGITAKTWAQGIESGANPGYVCLDGDRMVGMCFAERDSGEVLVVAVLPQYEGNGIGKELLERTLETLKRLGHVRSFLGCNPSPESRSHGFYRKLGWTSTGQRDSLGDEILEKHL